MAAAGAQGRGFSDVYLALGVLVIMALMVLRLPVAVIDALVAVNIAMGMGLLLLAIYIPSPVAFNSFPSVLLISTLFRLALSVATTRLILLDGDAGHIIDAFGQFVAGGNLVVGIVVFVIITVVQFIVIAKGAERVAEVSARFTLDAMPGKQMSIDSDLRSGLIDGNEARHRRELLNKESEMNGALDGAMKFVKGDAIASIIIVVVNLVGGLTVGVMQRGMAVGDAMAVYSILTIGDGMVAQIPALLGAMAAGLVVTRSGGDNPQSHLGSVIGEQLFTQPRALVVTGFISLLMALVPGFPSLVFLGLAAVLFTVGYFADPQQVRSFFSRGAGAADTDGTPHDRQGAGPATAQPVVLELADAVAPDQAHELGARLKEVSQRVGNELGIPLPECMLMPSRNGTCRFTVFDVPWRDHGSPGEGADAEQLAQAFEALLRQNASRFLGIQEVNDLINAASDRYDALVKEMLRSVSVQHIAQVLRNLVDEGIPVRNLRDIFEALVEWGGREKDPASLTEFVRIGLKRTITAMYADENGVLPAVVVQPEVEEAIRTAVTDTPAGPVLSISPEDTGALIDNLRGLLTAPDAPHVVICAIDVRRHVRSMVQSAFPEVHALSYQELAMPVNIVPRGRLALPARAA